MSNIIQRRIAVCANQTRDSQERPEATGAPVSGHPLNHAPGDCCVCESTEQQAMTGNQSRLLKADDRICWKASATDQGVIVGTDWSGVTIAWDDGDTNIVQHNDMSQIERALVTV